MTPPTPTGGSTSNYGHYVGHTAHVGARLRQHRGDEVESTAGGNPALVWTSGPLATRRDAAAFEAAMKSLRDQHSPRFAEITGVTPIPWRYGRRRAGWPVPACGTRRAGRSRRIRRMWVVIVVAAVLVVRVVIDAIGNALF